MTSRDLDESGCLSFDEFLMAMPANLINISQEEHKWEHSTRAALSKKVPNILSRCPFSMTPTF